MCSYRAARSNHKTLDRRVRGASYGTYRSLYWSAGHPGRSEPASVPRKPDGERELEFRASRESGLEYARGRPGESAWYARSGLSTSRGHAWWKHSTTDRCDYWLWNWGNQCLNGR